VSYWLRKKEAEEEEEEDMCWALKDAFSKTIRDMQLKHGKQPEQENVMKAYYDL
jgi:hypothetical protein